MNDSRAKRVARGSGTSLREVNELLDEYKKFAKMVGNFNMKKGGDLKNVLLFVLYIDGKKSRPNDEANAEYGGS